MAGRASRFSPGRMGGFSSKAASAVSFFDLTRARLVRVREDEHMVVCHNRGSPAQTLKGYVSLSHVDR